MHLRGEVLPDAGMSPAGGLTAHGARAGGLAAWRLCPIGEEALAVGVGGGANEVFDAAAEEVEVVADDVCGVGVGVPEVGDDF